jgi:predicted PurR-regulated permease PerM
VTGSSNGEVRERWNLRFVRVWAIIGTLLLIAAAGWLLSMISAAIVPFGLGLVIVLMLRHPVELLATRMNRTLAVLLCYLAAAIVVAIVLTFIIPPIYGQLAQFIQAVPDYARQAFKLWDTYIVHPKVGTGAPAWLQSAVVALKDQLVAGAGSWSTAIAQWAVSAGSSIATGIVSMAIAFIIGFYVLVDLPRLQTEVFTIAGERSRDELTHAIRTIIRVLGGWLRGTVIQSTVVAAIISIGLTIVGVPYALAIGVIGGLLNIVPYLGPFIALLIAGGAGLFISPTHAIWALVVVVAAQQLDALVLAPRILGEQVDLHPLLVIFALLSGAALFGVPGMVLSVPVAAVLKGLFVYWFEKRSDRPLSTEDGVLFPAAKSSEESDAGPEA